MGGSSNWNPLSENSFLNPGAQFRGARNTLFGSPQRTDQQIFPGYYEGTEGREFADTIRRLATEGFGLPEPVATGPAISPFRDPYRAALLDRFSPTTAETDVLNQVSDRTAANFASRGLGATPIAASATAASIAPTLVDFRSRQIEALRQALGGDVAENEAITGQNITQRGQTLQGLIAQFAARLQTLMNLFETAAIPRSLGAETRGGTNPILKPIDLTELANQIGSKAIGGGGGGIS